MDDATQGTADEFELYDLRVEATQGVALDDLRWLYPHMPEGGEASFRMWLETRGEATLYRFRDLAFTATGTAGALCTRIVQRRSMRRSRRFRRSPKPSRRLRSRRSPCRRPRSSTRYRQRCVVKRSVAERSVRKREDVAE